ncbi:MAG: anti-sigma factor [Gemmatimonadaceae bacterium]
MSHISPERLAALVDETAMPEEAAHLAECTACTDELAAHRRLVRLALAETSREGPPLNDWAALGAMLKAEGIVSTMPLAPPRANRAQWVMRIAAGLVLVAGSVLAGRWSVGLDFPAAPQQAASAAPASDAAPAPVFASPQAAMQVLTSSQQQYSDAAAYLAAQDTSSHFIGLNVNTYRARLTALDNIVASTRTALYQAPQDPVLNQYYLSAMAAREATLKQYEAALPAKQALERY